MYHAMPDRVEHRLDVLNRSRRRVSLVERRSQVSDDTYGWRVGLGLYRKQAPHPWNTFELVLAALHEIDA